jgi:hypothetical protein
MRKNIPALARALPLILLTSVSACEGESENTSGWGGGGTGSGGSGYGGSGYGGSGNPGSGFLYDLCKLLAPCCADAGLKSDPNLCAQMYASAVAGMQYDAQAGAACEAAIKTASNNGTVCAVATLEATSACDGVYKGTGGTRQPGETCDKDSDCAQQPTGTPECLNGYDSTTQSNFESCTNVFDGKAGDTPCVGYKTEKYTVYTVSGKPPTVGYVCDKAQALTCDTTTKACKALAKVGEACSWSDDCVDGAWCSTQLCQAKVGVGQPCTTSESQCDATTYCSDAKVCTTLVENGQPCKTSGECKSASCTNGACKASADLSLMFICQQ